MKLPPFMHEGNTVEIGSHVFEEADIIRFARKNDPQPFHLDPQAARESLFGGHCASGWHTASVWMRKQRDASAIMMEELDRQGFAKVEYGPSGGFQNLKWPRPVFAGDTVTYFNTTLACRPSASRPGWFVLSGRNGGNNQHGQEVLSFQSMVLLRYPA